MSGVAALLRLTLANWGLLVWSVAFVALYGGLSVGCAVGGGPPRDRPRGGLDRASAAGRAARRSGPAKVGGEPTRFQFRFRGGGGP